LMNLQDISQQMFQEPDDKEEKECILDGQDLLESEV